MALSPLKDVGRSDCPRLSPFAPSQADRIVSWVRGPSEAYWLAPRTPPPLTAEKVVDWAGPGREQHVLTDGLDDLPVGYGELNVLQSKRRTYWLGHLIVDPAWRGRGLGCRLTRLLLQRAFRYHAARRVTLVVFPENAAAIAAYRSAGMTADGYELHKFEAYRTRVELLRFVAAPDSFRADF